MNAKRSIFFTTLKHYRDVTTHALLCLVDSYHIDSSGKHPSKQLTS